MASPSTNTTDVPNVESSRSGDKCAITITTDDTCATTSTRGGTGAGAISRPANTAHGDENRARDDDPTDAGPAGEEEDGNGDDSRRHARSLAGGQKETWIEKNKRAPIIGGWRQTQWTANAYTNRTHVYKLSRDSPLTAGYEILEASGDRQAQKDYLMRHGTVQTRAEAGLPELPSVCPRKRNQQSA